MKLLFITQKVDKNDPVLGFVHRWIEKFSEKCELITVICLEKGEYRFPKNVVVISLGKELIKTRSGLVYFFYKIFFAARFLFLVFRMNDRDETVFVHMNAEYLALAGWLWRIKRRKVLMWYNHKFGSFFLKISAFWATNILYTSRHAYSARYAHGRIMPAGIDTDLFRRDQSVAREPRSILSLGRIAPVKRIELIIDAVSGLVGRGVVCRLHIYGAAEPRDKGYYEMLRARARDLEERGIIFFHDAISPNQAPHIYNKYEIFVNVTQEGSFDKTVLEALACEMQVVTTNSSFDGVVGEGFVEEDKITHKIDIFLERANTDLSIFRDQLREELQKKYGLDKLIEMLS